MNAGMIKAILGMTSGVCASYVTSHVVKATTPETIGRLGRVAVAIGGFVIGGMVAKSAGEYTEWQIGEFQHMFKS